MKDDDGTQATSCVSAVGIAFDEASMTLLSLAIYRFVGCDRQKTTSSSSCCLVVVIPAAAAVAAPTTPSSCDGDDDWWLRVRTTRIPQESTEPTSRA